MDINGVLEYGLKNDLISQDEYSAIIGDIESVHLYPEIYRLEDSPRFAQLQTLCMACYVGDVKSFLANI